MLGEDDLCVPDTICNYRHHSIILGDIAPCFLEMAPCKSLHPTLRCGNPGSVGGQAAAMPIVKTRKPTQVPVPVLLVIILLYRVWDEEGTGGEGRARVLQEEIKMTWKKRDRG